MTTVRNISPTAYELGCYVAIATSKEVRLSWETLIDTYVSADSLDTQPSENLGVHAQVVYNSTQAVYERLTHIVEEAKRQRADDAAFCPVYNFYIYDKERFYHVLKLESHKYKQSTSENGLFYSNIFTSYLKSEAITTLDLDSSFNGHSFKLPKCIFNVRNAKTLSLRNNQLSVLPPEIAKLQHLKVLRLSNNKLRNDSIPYTLTHCQEITTLLLDNNALDAVPGFVLELKKLETLHRHGNQNYFRTTFMWYVCEGRERIRTASFSDVDTASAALECVTNVQSLKFWAAKSIISRKCNYFLLSSIPESVKDYISEVYSLFNVCAACNTAELLYSTGYIVFTFKNPYINNTCVPFLHWTCSKECALAIELPARMQQIKTAQRQVKAYESYVRACALGGQPIIEEDPVSTETDLSDESRPAGRRRRWKLRRCNIM